MGEYLSSSQVLLKDFKDFMLKTTAKVADGVADFVLSAGGRMSI